MVAPLLLAVLFGAPSARAATRRLRNNIPSSRANDCFNANSDLLTTIKKNMNASVNPCENFYEYACGGWMSSNDIPDDKSSWGTFNILSDENRKYLTKMLEEKNGKNEFDKPRNYYHACMDMTAINAQGATPLKDLEKSLNLKFTGGSSKFVASDFETLAADLKKLYLGAGVDGVFFGIGVGPDNADSNKNTVGFSESGLSLRSREYYLDITANSTTKKDIDSDKILKALKDHIKDSMALFDGAGCSTLCQDSQAHAMIELEQDMAMIMYDKVKLRDPHLTYNPMAVSEIASKIESKFPFQSYLNGIYGELRNEPNFKLDAVDCGTPDYFKKLDETLAKHDKQTIVNKLRWSLVSSFMGGLSKEFYDEAFKMSQLLSGSKQQPPRSEICTGSTEGALSYYLSRMFIESKFTSSAKNVADTMIEGIRHAFLENLNSSSTDWMDSETKVNARDKANKIRRKIGYYTKIENATFVADYYKSVKAEAGGANYFSNRLSVTKMALALDADRIHKPVDKELWDMTAATVNAYYDPSKNEIVFPAGILQSPFFGKDYVMAYNFGGIGVVMGHELTHGFDDQGSEYDAEGNLKSWWKDSTKQAFTKKTQCIVNEYSNFTVNYEDGKKESVNGQLTLGENIADNGGIHLAFKAYRNFLEKRDPSFEACVELKGSELSAEKVFFLGFAQVWCSHKREAAEHQQLIGDPHSPSFARVNGAVANSKDFDEAFGCKRPAGYAEKQCRVW
mmetsp:Transcript_1656/g.2997  ORF Transcript_1656/g.2997 Transcript_1656/m.2997 type:complete len:736 (+) Transcript_1656:36-2243(+)